MKNLTTFTPNDAFTKKFDENGSWIVTDIKIKIDIIDALKAEMKEMLKDLRAADISISTFQINETLAWFRDNACKDAGISHLEFCELKTWAIREGVQL